MKSSEYWDKRALERLTNSEKQSNEYIKRIQRIYELAFRNISNDIENVYFNYSKNTGLDVEKLKKLLSVKETDKVWKNLKRQGLDKYIKNNYKSRISRLEQIQAQIYAKAKLIYPKEELQNTMCYKGIVNNSYYKTFYDTQVGTGYNFGFNKIDDNLINSILNERWSGKNYSDRIWTNTDILAESLSTIVGGGLLSGQSIEKTTKQLRDRFNVSKYYAERLVRTESAHFHNEADAMAYEEMGVDEYVFVATLDNRTSEICQSMDNKKFSYKDRKLGENYPPLHPNCRSTTRGFLGDDVEKMIRRKSRNPLTGKNELINNINYKDWLKQNNIINTTGKNIRTNQNILYDTNSLKKLDNNLVETNKKQLELLLTNYPKIAKFVNDNGLIFDGKDTNGIAYSTHTYDMKKLGIHLSNDYYSNSEKYKETISDNINSNWFMPCDEKNINTYALNHEFGHLVENYLISEYNKNNPMKYSSFEAKLKTINNQNQLKREIDYYETKICDKISQNIYNIALKNNKNFKLQDNLSKYGYEKSQEFFAECFANMISGKPNELGNAMKEYLKGVM